jgi:hypothetical protein
LFLASQVEGIDEIRKAAPQGTSASAVKSAAEDVAVKEQLDECLIPDGGRPRGTTRRAAAHKMEEAALLAPDCSQEYTAARDAPTPVDAEAVSMGKRRTRMSRRSKANMVSDQKEEAVATALTEPMGEERLTPFLSFIACELLRCSFRC